MDEHENFEDRLRAMADEISRSLQRMSEVDLDDLAERYGLDVDRARTFADAAGKWLSDRLPGGAPALIGGPPGGGGGGGGGGGAVLQRGPARRSRRHRGRKSRRPGRDRATPGAGKSSG